MADVYSTTQVPYSHDDILKAVVSYEIARGSGPYVVKIKVMHYCVISRVENLMVLDFINAFILKVFEQGFCHLLADTVRF